MSDAQAKKKVKREAKKEAKQITGNASLRQLKNDTFTNYYASQLSFLPAGEWAEVEACLRTPLPVTWRFSGHDDAARALRTSMESALLPQLPEKPQALAWYPDRLAWHFNVSRAQLRGKDWTGDQAPDGAGRSEPVKALHAYLVRETDLGRVQRQEAVSMVPPLLLAVAPGMRVLDMCASPGSKSQQMLEMLADLVHADEGGGAAAGGSGTTAGGGLAPLREARGLLVANDADLKRCHLLAARATKLNSPSLVVTNHDARLFPERLGGGDGDGGGGGKDGGKGGGASGASSDASVSAGGAAGGAAGEGVPLRFDRVLADVPCSGDGTLRKNPLIWRRWTAAPGNMLHALQYQIACKGVRLTEAGGRLVYSTCSMNPVENEAVVARTLLTFGPGCVRLVDVSAALPSLRRRDGITSWRVWHRGQWHADWPSVVERFPTKCPKLEPLFPPSEAELSGLNLERCVRLLPHDVDGSGFFIAVFEKLAEHDEEAGKLPDGLADVCVTEGAAVIPQELALSSGPAEAAKPNERPTENVAASSASASGATSGGRAAESADGGAAADTSGNTDGDAAPAVEGSGAGGEGVVVDTPEQAKQRIADCGMAVLHAHGGNSADAAVPNAASSYAPLFVPSSELVAELVAFYGLGAAFPAHRLVVRSPTARSLLLLADETRGLLERDTSGKLRVVNTGVRLFERDEAKGAACTYRLVQDGLGHTLPNLTLQRCACPPATLVALLTVKGGVSAAELAASHAELVESLRTTCRPGSAVLETAPADGSPLVHVVVLYAPSGAVSAMVKGLEKQALLWRLGVGAAPPAEDAEKAE